jgi:hypothetical protein
MISTTKLAELERCEIPLVGTFCEIRWTATNVMAQRQCEKCVYLVRGACGSLVCVELVYDAIEGHNSQDKVYWVPVEAVQVMRVLTMAQAQARMDRLEREAMADHPKD